LEEDLVMREGLLWYDDNPKLPLAAKIREAVRRYRDKFGRSPDLCFVHPDTLADSAELPNFITVATRATIGPNNFWVGVKRSGA
jgi:hypothetical protein